MIRKIIYVAFMFVLTIVSVSEVSAEDLATRLRGYILLQVQANGEAWYVNPNDGYRYYMKDGAAAYQIMRDFGLGITNENLKKIPVGINANLVSVHDPDSDRDDLGNKTESSLGTNSLNADSDGDGYSDGIEVSNGYNPLGPGRMMYDYTLANRLKGKILLQVEASGEAWYVNPKDGKRYYMANGEMAYQVMRYLSLGITNTDLQKIPTKESVVEWKTYTDSELGFAITYPTTLKTYPGRTFSAVRHNDSACMGLMISQQPNDFVWGVCRYDGDFDVQQAINQQGSQFSDRKQVTTTQYIGGRLATISTVTTNQYPDWVSIQVYIHEDGYVYVASNGATNDPAFTQFYQSLDLDY